MAIEDFCFAKKVNVEFRSTDGKIISEEITDSEQLEKTIPGIAAPGNLFTSYKKKDFYMKKGKHRFNSVAPFSSIYLLVHPYKHSDNI